MKYFLTGSRCSCRRLWRTGRPKILAHQELLVHVLGQRRLRPHVAEEQQLRRRNCRHLRYPQEELQEQEAEKANPLKITKQLST
jgi:hypothetical protein